jgi:hypothetical protein
MPLAALHLLAGIRAPVPFRGLHVEAIKNGGRGLGVASRLLRYRSIANLEAQGVVHPLLGAIEAPVPVVVRAGGAGNHAAAGAATAGKVEEGVDPLAHIHLTRSAAGLGGRNQGRDERPLGIGKIGGIGFAFRTPSDHTASDFSHTLSWSVGR